MSIAENDDLVFTPPEDGVDKAKYLKDWFDENLMKYIKGDYDGGVIRNRYYKIIFHWQFPSVSSATRDPSALSTPQLQQLTLRGENAPSPTKLLYSPLWAALLCSRAFWRSTLDNPEHHGPYRASSWPFSCFLFPCTVTSAPYATGAPRHATSTHFSPQNLLLRLWPTN